MAQFALALAIAIGGVSLVEKDSPVRAEGIAPTLTDPSPAALARAIVAPLSSPPAADSGTPQVTPPAPALAPLVDALYSEDRFSRVAAAQALHPYITNGWIPKPVLQMPDAQLRELMHSVWPTEPGEFLARSLSDPAAALEPDTMSLEVLRGARPAQDSLQAVASYLAMRCGLPVDEFLVRQTRWTPEFVFVATAQARNSMSATNVLDSHEFRDDVLAHDATPCRALRQDLAFS